MSHQRVGLAVASAAAMREIKPKKKCCADRPRCKRCPVMLKRLQKAGLAESLPSGRVLVNDGITKQQLKRFR